MKTTTLVTALVMVAWLAVQAAPPKQKNTMLTNRIGPSASTLFIANGDGTGEKELLPEGNFDYDASFSADGKWIVFTSERKGAANIYRVHPDGTGLERITSDTGFDDQAVLSPDGKQLAFVSTRETGNANVWVLDLSTHKARNLTHTNAPYGTFRPAWSPDGRWLAFSSDRNTEADRHVALDHSKGRWEHLIAASVYIIHPDGTELRRITQAGQFDGSPKWSADGKLLVFYELPVENTFLARGFGEADSQIVSVEVATGERKVRTSGPGMKISPQFLSGDKIGYVSKVNRNETGGLAFTTGAKGPNVWLRNPDWSADGKHVVYQHYVYDNKQWQPIFTEDAGFDLHFSHEFPAVSPSGRVSMTPFGEGTARTGPPEAVVLSTVDLDGSNVKKLYADKDGGAYSAAWSPDGQWLAFGFGYYFVDRTSKPAKIMMVRADGTGVRDFTSGPLNSGFPSWSPDGKHIVYRVWGQNELGLRVQNIDDGSVTKLTKEGDNFPFYSPQGDRIAFTRAGKNAFDIFTIKPDGTDLKQLTDAPGNDAHCAWSPDGRYIVFSSSRLGFRDEGPLYDHAPQPYAELFIMNADGSNQRPITDDKWEEGTPAWVPSAAVEKNLGKKTPGTNTVAKVTP